MAGGAGMDEEDEDQLSAGLPEVDRGLVAMFIKMSPEDRLLANDRMRRTIQDLRDAFKQRKASTR